MKKEWHQRFPSSVYGVGDEPDPRFSLANERTFLAWNRTALALFATGVALEALGAPIDRGFRLVAAIAFVVLGLLAAGQGWFGWARTERALRQKMPMQGPTFAPFVTAGVALAFVFIAIGLLW